MSEVGLMNEQEYKVKHEKLMTEWEQEARKWLLDTSNRELSEKIPFFRDGITCPEVWFDKDNTFRPLFILKEVSIGKNKICEVSDFLEIWGNKKTFEFAQYDFDDIKVGTFSQWKRIARLAKAFEDVHNGVYPCDYGKYDFSFRDGGEIYNGDIVGYKDKKYYRKTANTTYSDIINKIAILELKKIGAGQDVNSELSIATKHYTEHIKQFKERILEQIKLIKPTVIIGLGREGGACISELLSDIKPNISDVIWIEGYHHASRLSNKKFYDELLEKYHLERNK